VLKRTVDGSRPTTKRVEISREDLGTSIEDVRFVPIEVCPKCGSDEIRIVGQSGEPPLVHRGCQRCTHVFSRLLHDDDGDLIFIVPSRDSSAVAR